MREIKFRAWDKEEKKMIEADNVVIFNIQENNLSELFKEQQEYFEFMQYIGLKDKNGKEIYEGDFLRTRKGLISYVEYYYNEFTMGKFCHLDEEFELYEVIGNIHENPELL